MNNKLLTPAEAAEQLRVNVRTVYEYIKTGQLVATKLGHRTVRIQQHDLDNLIESGQGVDECS